MPRNLRGIFFDLKNLTSVFNYTTQPIALFLNEPNSPPLKVQNSLSLLVSNILLEITRGNSVSFHCIVEIVEQ